LIGKNVFSNLHATNAACAGFGVNIGYSTAEGLSHNTFVGSDIAQNAAGVYAYCAAVGSGALKNVNASNNTAMGYNSLSEVTTGQNNVGFGIRAGNAYTSVTTGTGNTFIGATSGSDNSNRVNGTAIGQNARVDFDNCVQLGNTNVTQVRTNGTLHAAGLESIGTNSTLTIAGSDNTKVVEIGKGTGVQVIHIGNSGAGATTITLGGASDTVTLGGSISSIEGTVVNFKDPTVVFGYGSAANSSGGSGVYLAEGTETLGCYMRLSSDRTKFEFKPRVGANTFVIDQSLQTTDTVTFGGLKLPTTGGTARTLNYYEEYLYNTNFTGATYTANYGILFVRIGKLVTMTLPNQIPFTATSTGILISEVKYPERFRSYSDIQFPIEISDNSVRVGGIVSLGVGNVAIACAHFSNFINGRTYLTYPFSLSWVLD